MARAFAEHALAAQLHVAQVHHLPAAAPHQADRFGRLAVQLEEAEWTLAALEATIRSFAEAEGVGIGKFGPALRAVLSGGSPAPDLAGALISIGRDESLARIHDALPNEALGGIRL